MPDFIVSWSAYGPSGRLQAASQDDATAQVQQALTARGLATEATREDAFDGEAVILRSAVKRYGDMSSFAVCVYPVGGRSFYDAQRDQVERLKAQDTGYPSSVTT